MYKRQKYYPADDLQVAPSTFKAMDFKSADVKGSKYTIQVCLLYTSDAADDLLCVDLGGRRIIKKKKVEDNATKYSPIILN